MSICKEVTGYCPEQKRNATIYIELKQAETAFITPPQYVKNSFCCEHYIFHGCNCCGETHLACPIFMASFDRQD